MASPYLNRGPAQLYQLIPLARRVASECPPGVVESAPRARTWLQTHPRLAEQARLRWPAERQYLRP